MQRAELLFVRLHRSLVEDLRRQAAGERPLFVRLQRPDDGADIKGRGRDDGIRVDAREPGAVRLAVQPTRRGHVTGEDDVAAG